MEGAVELVALPAFEKKIAKYVLSCLQGGSNLIYSK